MRLGGAVSFHVQGQVVGAGEGPVAEGAGEGAVTRVLAVVPRQLVRPGEAPSAVRPVAAVRLLT